jgi:hypothetical protein
MNSRSIDTGVIRLEPTPSSDPVSFRTMRRTIPTPVRQLLADIRTEVGTTAGTPDLVIWNQRLEVTQLIEVKRLNRDRVSREQREFLKAASRRGIDARVEEWEFNLEEA